MKYLWISLSPSLSLSLSQAHLLTHSLPFISTSKEHSKSNLQIKSTPFILGNNFYPIKFGLFLSLQKPEGKNLFCNTMLRTKKSRYFAFILVFSTCLQYFSSLINQKKFALSYEVCFPSAIFLSFTIFIIDIIRTFNSIPTIKINYIIQLLTTYSKAVLTW